MPPSSASAEPASTTTMHDICREAGVSPGALYVYFDSKEALIAGICERDRQEFAERFDQLATAPDFMQALRALGDQYSSKSRPQPPQCASRSAWNRRATRARREIFQRFDRLHRRQLREVVPRYAGRRPHRPVLDIPTVAKAFTIVCDGMFWRRAVDPAFDPVAADAGGAATQSARSSIR